MHSLLRFPFSSLIVMWLNVNVRLKLPEIWIIFLNIPLFFLILFLHYKICFCKRKLFQINPFFSQTVCFLTLYFASVLSYINSSSPCYNDSVSREVFPINFSVRIELQTLASNRVAPHFIPEWILLHLDMQESGMLILQIPLG